MFNRATVLNPLLTRLALAGEICREWQSWSEYLHVNTIFGQSFLQATIYIALSVRSTELVSRRAVLIRSQIAFAGSSAVLVMTYAP